MGYFLLCLVFFATLILKSIWRPKNFPPGPRVWPLVGNLFQLGSNMYDTTIKLIPKYGEIQGYKMGSHWMVMLNNPEDVREAFGMTEFSHRGGYNVMQESLVRDRNNGLIFSFGPKWAHHRRFTLKTLRDFGFAKKSSETIIMEEVRELRERFRQKVGRPFTNFRLFNAAVFNVIWCLLAGERYPHDDARIESFMQLFDKYLASNKKGLNRLLYLFPNIHILRQFCSFLFPKETEPGRLREQLFQFFREAVQSHRETHQIGQPRDYIDAMIDESIQEDNIKEMDFLVTLIDFFLAGSETTSTMLRWTLFLMAKFPEVQEKLAKEILSVASNRDVSLDDRPSCPYVDAVTQEIFRLSSLTSGGVPHFTSETVTFKGVIIPGGTMILPNIYGAHYRRDIWGDPENFRPERFMSKANERNGNNNQVGTRHKAWIPFGVGKRACLGQGLALDEFFLVFTNLVQSFRIAFPETDPPHGLTAVNLTGIRNPEDHKIVLRERN